MGANNKNNFKPQQKSSLKRYKGKNVSPFSGAVQMGQYAARLLRNMAFQNFDLEKDGIMFQNRDFLIAAYREAENKVVEQQIYVNGLSYAYACSTDANVIRMINKHKRALDGWNMVYNTIGSILQTGDLGLLAGLMNRLPDYRHVLY